MSGALSATTSDARVGVRERVGILGGAFDPPHFAHVAIARAAMAQAPLDRLLVLPTGSPVHKAGPVASAADRVAMAGLAFANLQGAEVDERETRRAGASYMIDTLRELAAERPGADWFLVIGDDQAAAFDRWRDWRTIVEHAMILIAARSDFSRALGGFDLKTASPDRIRMLDTPQMPESATDVRRRVAAGESIDALVPAAVARYIDRHQLYSRPRKTG